jgi:hypothetical protein
MRRQITIALSEQGRRDLQDIAEQEVRSLRDQGVATLREEACRQGMLPTRVAAEGGTGVTHDQNGGDGNGSRHILARR